VLNALARRMPSVAHRKTDGHVQDVPLDGVAIGDLVVVFPHEICPVDGTVVDGHGAMDESYLTGEPYVMSKAPGTGVLSGAVNGESALTIRAERLAVDSRYAKIMQVMRESDSVARRSAVSAINSVRSTRPSPWRSRWWRGSSVARRNDSSPCWSWPRRVRSSSRFPSPSSGLFHSRRGAASSYATPQSSRK
jgi:magnesium-transporting ATPase (P-type)